MFPCVVDVVVVTVGFIFMEFMIVCWICERGMFTAGNFTKR